MASDQGRMLKHSLKWPRSLPRYSFFYARRVGFTFPPAVEPPYCIIYIAGWCLLSYGFRPGKNAQTHLNWPRSLPRYSFLYARRVGSTFPPAVEPPCCIIHSMLLLLSYGFSPGKNAQTHLNWPRPLPRYYFFRRGEWGQHSHRRLSPPTVLYT